MIEERKQSDRLRLWFWRGAAILVIIVFFTARYMMRDQLPVRTANAVRRQLENTISTNGRVEPENNYEFYSPISTTVKAVYVQPGDHVQAGQLLLVLDDTEARARLATAESGVKAAQAAVEAATHNGTQQERQAAAAEVARDRLSCDQARRDLAALTKLKATGAASTSEVTDAQQRLDAAQDTLHVSQQSAKDRYSSAEIERARAQLVDAEANSQAARQVIQKTSIHAPISGTVYKLNASPTDFTEQGKLLFQLADLHLERVRAYFDEPEIGKLAVGQPIEIKWDAEPGREWHGHIVRIPVSVVTYGTRNVGEVIVKIDDADGGLLPDTNVTVTVTTSSEPNVLSIPREALHSENGKSYVYKVVNHKLVRTPVTIGTINLTQVAIRSGLNEGDTVATGSANGQPLQDDIPVKVVR